MEPLHDLSARIDAQLTALDEMIAEADREIARLEALLAANPVTAVVSRELSAADQQRCFALWEAGRPVADIARRLRVTPEQVQAALDEFRTPRRRAA